MKKIKLFSKNPTFSIPKDVEKKAPKQSKAFKEAMISLGFKQTK